MESIIEQYSDRLEEIYDNPNSLNVSFEVARDRAIDLMTTAADGYGVDFDEFIDIIRSDNFESNSNSQTLLTLAVNLINFSVAQQYHFTNDLISAANESNSFDQFNAEFRSLADTYYARYSSAEDYSVLLALGVAREVFNYDNNVILQYNTQEDERVRPSHNALNGLRFRKASFPPALIPPIDFNCRCFITSTGSTDGRTLNNRRDTDSLIESTVNPIFSGSPAINGIMFSESHPYFSVADAALIELSNIVRDIRRDLDV